MWSLFDQPCCVVENANLMLFSYLFNLLICWSHMDQTKLTSYNIFFAKAIWDDQFHTNLLQFLFLKNWRIIHFSVFTVHVKIDYDITFQKRVRVFYWGFQTQENWWKPKAVRPKAFIILECLEIPVKHEAQVFEMASQSAPNCKQKKAKIT